MAVSVVITPQGHLIVAPSDEPETVAVSAARAQRIAEAFARGAWAGVLHLATVELQSALPADLAFVREVGRRYLTRLCRAPALNDAQEMAPLAPPEMEELSSLALQAPPMTGLEYLSPAMPRTARPKRMTKRTGADETPSKPRRGAAATASGKPAEPAVRLAKVKKVKAESAGPAEPLSRRKKLSTDAPSQPKRAASKATRRKG